MSAPAPCLMVQGTASGVGKSLLAAAFCRIPLWGSPAGDKYEHLADAVARAVDVRAFAKLAGLSFPRL